LVGKANKYLVATQSLQPAIKTSEELLHNLHFAPDIAYRIKHSLACVSVGPSRRKLFCYSVGFCTVVGFSVGWSPKRNTHPSQIPCGRGEDGGKVSLTDFLNVLENKIKLRIHILFPNFFASALRFCWEFSSQQAT